MGNVAPVTIAASSERASFGVNPPTTFRTLVDETMDDFDYAALHGVVLESPTGCIHPAGMSTLAEIEQAAATLPPVEQQELLLYLAARLRARGASLPEPRLFSAEQLKAWMDEDEADLRRFDAGQ